MTEGVVFVALNAFVPPLRLKESVMLFAAGRCALL